MTRKTTLLIALLATLALIGVMLVVANFIVPVDPEKKVVLNSFKDAATTLAFIGGAAVGIERVLEAFWTLMGGVVGTFWPLNVINKQVETLVGELDSALKPFHEEALRKIAALKNAAPTTEELERLTKAENEVGALKARFDDIKKLAPDNQRIQLLTAAASQNVAVLKEKFGDLLTNS